MSSVLTTLGPWSTLSTYLSLVDLMDMFLNNINPQWKRVNLLEELLRAASGTYCGSAGVSIMTRI